MLRPGGYATIVTPDATQVNFDHLRCEEIAPGTFESDTYSCFHCNRVIHAPVRRKDTDYFFCRNCMGRICPSCADHPCIPFMKKVEEQEEKDRRLRSYGG